MVILLAIVSLIATAFAKDLTVGHGGHLVSHKHFASSWRRNQNVTIDVPITITRISIIDNREDKNGKAAIVEGGIGFKHVTINLDSPGFLKAYDFDILVFAQRFNKQENKQTTSNLETADESQEVTEEEIEEDDEDVELEKPDLNIQQYPEKIVKIWNAVKDFVKVGKMASELFSSRKPMKENKKKYQVKEKIKRITPIIKIKNSKNNKKHISKTGKIGKKIE